MARILITSGPTREYLDPVRYLTNASSGRMGAALAEAALAEGHEVVMVSGPVEVQYPPEVSLQWVLTTDEMLLACEEIFPKCDGLIGVAAPCDYKAEAISPHKIRKTGQPIQLDLVETVDIMAELAKIKGDRWMVGFALETEDTHFRAMTKLQKKNCDFIVLNGPEAMHAHDTSLEVLNHQGEVVLKFTGTKEAAARRILERINQDLLR
ncbi:Coenzyme A biosynthesis bifunctional protein CoaBC [Planctomycetales bacterium 10988]|nr:Coenzyme A biosynthesis bifunctional protein CoaBC [Planctomycetales bacterium 10988]